MDNLDPAQLIASGLLGAKQQSGEEFSQATIKEAWKRSQGHCECMRKTCGHVSRCNKKLVFKNRNEGEKGAWEAHHIVSKECGGEDNASNCEILCLECHKHTDSYGRHD